MENLIFYKAGIDDIDLLTEVRVEVLRAANNLDENVDMEDVRKASYEYYKNCFEQDTHVAYLVKDNGKIAGSGGISFYQVMPTYHNKTGRKAYVMNMFTAPSYRRKGIAMKVLDLLVQEAHARGIHAVSLEATSMGRPLYIKYGFVQMKDEMELPGEEIRNPQGLR
ncbi:MAG: GNAT family N-acetyltransferase [Eubacteriales bacterium]|nr:GNAT family N-acetyltransferase [Eubacteriales bacterium]